METKRILMTLEERDKWVRRKEELVERLKGLSKKERKGFKDEVERIDREISYYEGLIRQMKGDVDPNKMRSLLKDL